MDAALIERIVAEVVRRLKALGAGEVPAEALIDGHVCHGRQVVAEGDERESGAGGLGDPLRRGSALRAEGEELTVAPGREGFEILELGFLQFHLLPREGERAAGGCAG